MKAALLALLLSQEPAAIYHAPEPPPSHIARLEWRFSDISERGWYLTDAQAKLTSARMNECELQLRECQVENAKPLVPPWAWVTLGVALGAGAAWAAGVAR